MLQEFLQNQDLKDCDNLRFVLSGGESLSSSLNELFTKKSDAILYNGYGPTETAICVILWHCTPPLPNKMLDAHLINTNGIPIGHAVSNTQFFILDERNLPVALGTIGELCIGGVQVAKGYLNRKELSDEKFIQIDIDNQSVRLYKTGDLVRYLPNGALLFIGRRDSQVKIRGLRIELGEIEKTLALYPAIKQAACLINSTTDLMSQKITAFYLENEKYSSSKIDTQELKLFLSQHIPLYMIPQSFIKINSFPMLASGELDMKKLIRTYDASSKKVVANDEQENTTEIQAIIISIWREALNIDSINVYDNFFDIGGNSLLSVQIINNIETKTGVKLETRALVMESLAQISYPL